MPLLLAIAALLWTGIASGQPPAYPPQAEIQAVTNRIRADSLRAVIERLQNFQTRHTYSDTASATRGIGAALRWVDAQIRARDPRGRWSIEWFPYTRQWNGGPVTRHILIARAAGTAAQRARYIAGGHLDSRTTNGSDTESFAPGADDNGSGCAALLELVRILPDSFAHDLELIWFTGEEQGLWGSEAYAAYLAQQGARVDGMLALDMIGHIRSPSGGVDSSSVRLYAQGLNSQGGYGSISRGLQRYIRWTGEAYADDMTLRIIPATDRPGRGSDHIPFSENGFPAVRLIESNEDLAFQHGPADTLGNMSPGYTRKVAQAAFGALLTMLNAPPRPPAPELEWLDDRRLRVAIPDSVTLPEGGGFLVTLRGYLSSDFDSIADIGAAREIVFDGLSRTEVYTFAVSRTNAAGRPSPFSREVESTQAATEPPRAPLAYNPTLYAYPNPFNRSVTLRITLERPADVELAVFDVLGRFVAELHRGPLNAGSHAVAWRPEAAASGIYVASLQSGGKPFRYKLLYLR